jgi:hypothetical protein
MTFRSEALFLNGVFKNVVEEILLVQEHAPYHIMYMQPFSPKRIVRLADNLPSVNDRVRLLLSTTENLAHIHYVGEIVGWDNKQSLSPERSAVLNRLIWSLQPAEGGLYFIHSDEARQSINLLSVWCMKRLGRPFSVGELQLDNTGEAHSTERKTAGGWSYVRDPGDEWLTQFQ